MVQPYSCTDMATEKDGHLYQHLQGKSPSVLPSEALKLLKNTEKIQLRMMYATFNNNNPCTTIISCYNPTNVSDDRDVIIFYNKLSSLVRHIPKHYILIISEDMNAHIGKGKNNEYCFYNSPNRNEHQTKFALKNRLVCLKAKLQKKKRKLQIYAYPK